MLKAIFGALKELTFCSVQHLSFLGIVQDTNVRCFVHLSIPSKLLHALSSASTYYPIGKIVFKADFKCRIRRIGFYPCSQDAKASMNAMRNLAYINYGLSSLSDYTNFPTLNFGYDKQNWSFEFFGC